MSSNASRYQVAWSGLCVRAARLGIRGLDAYSEAEARARVRALVERFDIEAYSDFSAK